jgi:hypothetical protein
MTCTTPPAPLLKEVLEDDKEGDGEDINRNLIFLPTTANIFSWREI